MKSPFNSSTCKTRTVLMGHVLYHVLFLYDFLGGYLIYMIVGHHPLTSEEMALSLCMYHCFAVLDKCVVISRWKKCHIEIEKKLLLLSFWKKKTTATTTSIWVYTKPGDTTCSMIIPFAKWFIWWRKRYKERYRKYVIMAQKFVSIVSERHAERFQIGAPNKRRHQHENCDERL